MFGKKQKVFGGPGIFDHKTVQHEPPPPPINPLTRPHIIISGPAALKLFAYLTAWEQHKDRAARCRLWMSVNVALDQAFKGDERAGEWRIMPRAVDLVVWKAGKDVADEQ